MPALEPYMAVLVLLAAALTAFAAMLAAAMRGHGPLYGSLVVARRGAQDIEGRAGNGLSADSVAVGPDRPPVPVRSALKPEPRAEGSPRRLRSPDETELDEVLRGGFAAAAFNRGARGGRRLAKLASRP